MPHRRSRIVTVTLLLLALVSIPLTRVQFTNGSYQTPDTQQWIASALPMTFDSATDVIEIRTMLNVLPMRPRTFRIIPDDCLEDLWINDTHVQHAEIPFCDYTAGRIINLAAYLHNGENVLRATVRNTGGHGSLQILSIRASVMDALPYVFLLLALLAVTIAMARAE